jgi:hypothetical protein
MKKERKMLPFTNNFGDVINPGDSVYVITTCTHRTHVAKGEYVGYLERLGYDWKTKKSTTVPAVQVKTPYTKTVYWDKRTDKPFKWSDYTTSEVFKEHVETRNEPAFRISTLNYNRIVPAGVSADRLMAAV